MTQDNALDIWTVYAMPAGSAAPFVARRFQVDSDGHTLTDDILQAETLAALRAQLPPGLIRLARSERDDPNILESWI
ncbi:hypothetical protein [Cupriavidus pampae]|jgi:hypothetical protein|uniref:Uncharacterized protein n=1 Tax=Cupriavidus pampae TaxID=659251 RepID=A0ABM8XU42_9BURK|nr:hypothetical protein [Cupriavidus pampae]CAG9183737.1 hypothetical protein LMG32289_05405 [Cupriavidus pampae]